MDVLINVKYTRIRQIGCGAGMNSEVYLGRDPQRDGEFAFKEIPKAHLDDQGIADYFQEAKAMFASEHPENVVPVHFAGENDAGTHICIGMPYYKKGSLADRIEHHPVSIVEAIQVGIDMLSGLQRIHNAGFVHFDVKPSNILFSNRDDPMVADFGQTKAINPATGSVPIPWMYTQGTPPECFRSEGTIRSDIFQAGSTLYRAVNGEPFFSPQKQSHPDISVMRRLVESAANAGKLPNRDLFLPHVPRALKIAIRKAIAVKPTDRYKSAADFAVALGKTSVGYNWKMENRPDDEAEWIGTKSTFAPISVTLTHDGPSSWKVQVHSCGQSRRRRGKNNGLWKRGMTQEAAVKHLQNVFRSLG